MKYIVFTSKHHEGFAMYKSTCSPYNVVDATPCHRDIVKELADACRKYDMKLGLYYSQAQDWHDPNGYVAHVNLSEDGLEGDNDTKDFQYYLDHKVKPQLTEILTQYGDICLIWFDTPMGMTAAQSRECIDLVKRLQPNCIVSGRVGNQMGNYLLNIGPMATGEIPEESVRILDEVGKYVTENAEGIFATKPMEAYPYELDWGELTAKDHKLFLHTFKPRKRLELLNCGNIVKRAYLLKDGRELKCTSGPTCEGDGFIDVEIPGDLRPCKNYCVCLELEEKDPVFEPLRG